MTSTQIKERVSSIISNMSVDEKIDQLILCDIHELLNELEQGKKPHLYGFFCMTDAISDSKLRELKQYVRDNTQNHIPFILVGECLHGIMHPEGTIFPQSIAMGATFNKELMGEVASTIGREAHALGYTQVLAPDVDIARDARWGRVEETYGEDTYLVSQFAEKYVEGIQNNGVASTLKHYIAYCAPEGGINLAPPHVGEREMREYFLPPFESAIKKGAMTLMPSYTEVDGVPVHASKKLLRELLRDELKFEGTTISDYGAVNMLNTLHKTARTYLEAGIQAIEAGVDIEAAAPCGYCDEFRDAVKNGVVDIALIDEAVERILTLKFKLGLFDGDPVDSTLVHSPEAIELAYKAALESIILLENSKKALPLNSNVKKIALIGPNADNLQYGDYTDYKNMKDTRVTPRTVFETYFGKENLLYAMGSSTSVCSEEDICLAENAAKNADVAILMLGDNSKFFGGVGWGTNVGDTSITCGEGFDVSDLSLPSAQIKLLERIHATGTPVILILNTGRVYSIKEISHNADAIIQMFYAGEKGAEALIDILMGKECPSGKLPMSIPQSVGHVPCFYNYKPAARGFYKEFGSPDKPGRDYVFSSPEPLYPFGYGLSYADISYSDIKAQKSDDAVTISLKVKNSSDYSVKEAVLLFDSVEYCIITQPVKSLCAFEKIALGPNEEKEISFTLPFDSFTYVDENMKRSRLTGDHTITVGNLSVSFEI